jgi:gamma-glutamyltranspeptidase/glutathione hydrolase
LQDGGNAVDAAIAANAVVSVAWPHMCGIGGDLFMLVYWARSEDVFGLNASGRASRHASVERVRALGHQQMPTHGGLAVNVPGAVDGWATALERFGTRGLDELLAPAVRYAEHGFPITALLSQAIQNKLPIFTQYPAALDVYVPAGRPLRPGDRLANPDLARTLRTIGREGRSGFYSGEVASLVSAAIRQAGGLVDEEDMAAQRSDWMAPLRTSYRGLEVCEMPPNTQGVTALQLFNLMEGFDLASAGHNSAQSMHWMVESKRLAFADRDRFVTDPSAMPVAAEQLASKAHAEELHASIGSRTAPRTSAAGLKLGGDTIYLCVVDRHGNAVSLIQSLFDNFGSGVVVPGAGVVLQNRSAAFNLDPVHPNHLAPRKRPLHTLIPALALSRGKPALVFGTRGANGQPQTQAQVLANVVRRRLRAEPAGGGRGPALGPRRASQPPPVQCAGTGVTRARRRARRRGPARPRSRRRGFG